VPVPSQLAPRGWGRPSLMMAVRGSDIVASDIVILHPALSMK
jgi:hypothetical protein